MKVDVHYSFIINALLINVYVKPDTVEDKKVKVRFEKDLLTIFNKVFRATGDTDGSWSFVLTEFNEENEQKIIFVIKNIVTELSEKYGLEYCDIKLTHFTEE